MNENTQEEGDFEATLQGFRTTPAPAELREEILSIATGLPDTKVKLRPILLTYFGALATAWVAILGFRLATPNSGDHEERMPIASIASRPLPILAPPPHGKHHDMGAPRAYLPTVCQINHLLGETHL